MSSPSKEIGDSAKKQPDQDRLPVVPLRASVIFPGQSRRLILRRESSRLAAAMAARHSPSFILAVPQTAPDTEHPDAADLAPVGTLVQITSIVETKDNSLAVQVEASKLVGIAKPEVVQGVFYAGTKLHKIRRASARNSDLLSTELREKLSHVGKAMLVRDLPSSLTDLELEELIATIASSLSMEFATLLSVFQEPSQAIQSEQLLVVIEAACEAQAKKEELRQRVRSRIETSQRNYFLREHLKLVKSEIDKDSSTDDTDVLEEKINSANLPEHAHEAATAELKRMGAMSPMSAEASVCRNYIEWILKLPWQHQEKSDYTLTSAKAQLDADHYGLEDVKERILEHLAVQKRRDTPFGQVLCLVGPPGIGKTSLGRSIAAAMKRPFARAALGGVDDEAEIRGHRRTYVGSLPGVVLQRLARTKANNPVFILDEIDKLGKNFRGDPASALLEVLDPEQNHTFIDHFLEIEFDLSQVFFVCTANQGSDIPVALRDRMDVLQLSGYTRNEKTSIAKRHLIPKQLKANGLRPSELRFGAGALENIIELYTRESGVRQLDRLIARVCRQSVLKLQRTKEEAATQEAEKPAKKAKQAKKKTHRVNVAKTKLADWLGEEKFRPDEEIGNHTVPGIARGLAYTSYGGDILWIEATHHTGKGNGSPYTVTGNLGNVMKESTQAAFSVARRYLIEHDLIQQDDFAKLKFHLHFPAGATPKDGPSAGIAIATALVSSVCGTSIRAGLAMTGEVSLVGRVLAVGGVKEKILAAQRYGMNKVLIPHSLRSTVETLDSEITDNLDIHFVKTFDEVVLAAFAKLTPYEASSTESTEDLLDFDTQADRPNPEVASH